MKMKWTALTILLLGFSATLLPGCKPSPNGYHSGMARLGHQFTLATHYAKRKEVRQQVQFYRHHVRYINQCISNAQDYFPYVYRRTKALHMPIEVALLPMIESGFDPFVYSKRGATGIWQMMPGTASGYGIPINWWYDGRRDLIASTHAALTYLAYLHKRFGSWLLALAAYDAGEGTVQQAIKRNRQRHLPTDYWALSLPNETRHYVPKLLALAEILQNPRRYQIHLSGMPISSKPRFAPLWLNGQLAFNQIATITGTKLSTLRRLNAGYRRWATAPVPHNRLLLPLGKSQLLAAHLEKTHLQTLPANRVHTVLAGETLGQIAQHYHTTVATIVAINQLHGSAIQAQQKLRLPGASQAQRRHAPALIAADSLPGPKRLTHRVRRRESLRSISRLYHVTPAKLRFWNHLASKKPLTVGQQLIIWQPHHQRGSRFAWYTVRSGDSISAIAHRFGISTAALKRINHLNHFNIRIGQVLKIPSHFEATA